MKAKMKALAEVMLYLPGFGPGENPLALPARSEAEAEPVTATVIPFPLRKEPERVVLNAWPSLGEVCAPSGEADRIERNLAALRLLRVLDAENRPPTIEERATLNAYTGWGAVSKLFDGHWSPLAKQRKEALELLDEESWKAAKASVNTGFFTPPEVCRAMWSWIRQAGFAGGRILEPSAGTGLLLGTMPEDIAANSKVTAIEKDHGTGRILRALYAGENTQVEIAGFEEVELAEGFFDLAIGNVPFGSYGVHCGDRKDYANWLIHDYFFGRSMDLVREGGLLAFLTSSGTLDKVGNNQRQWLAAHGDLIHAVRLPLETFKNFAGTRTSVDFLILRKRMKSEAPGPRKWVGGLRTEVVHGLPVVYNTEALPKERFLGGLGIESGRYGYYSAVASGKGDWREHVRQAVEALPVPACYTPRIEQTPRTVAPIYREKLDRRVKPGTYLILSDGRIGVSNGTEAEAVERSKPEAARIEAMIPLREAVRRVVEGQVSDMDDAKLERLRLDMNLAYEAFTKAFGPIHRKENIRALRTEPDLPLLLSLEKWDDEGGTTEKADIFYRRTAKAVVIPDRCDTVAEAVIVSLARNGCVVPEHVATMVGRSIEEVEAAMREEGLAFRDPVSGHWEPSDLYLSGDVKTKLAAARTAGHGYESNVEALLAVIPPDIPAKEIEASLGACWLTPAIIESFAKEVLERRCKVTVSAATYRWEVHAIVRVNDKKEFSTSRSGTLELLALALNQKEPRLMKRGLDGKPVLDVEETMAACEAQGAIKEAFEKWLMADATREAEVVRLYNDRMNRNVPRRVDGRHLVLPGYSGFVTLREHQVNAIWRIVTGRSNTLLAHVVGAGKTLVMICAAMELRRTGKARKPLIVVPNHMLEQFTAEFLRAYPGASVLAASKDDFDADGRKRLVARMAAWDWDAIIMTHASFAKVQATPSNVEAYIQHELDRLESAESSTEDRSTVKELQAATERMRKRLRDLQNERSKDDLLTLKECGVDFLMVDEAHLFKNLYRFSRMDRVAGLPASDSQRAFDMLMKVREIESIRGDECGVVFATGTPVANSMAELWVMQSYLQHNTLRRYGMDLFDGWAATYGKIVKGVEVTPTGGGYRVNSRFAKFVNLPELMAVFSEVADIQTKDMLKLPTPVAHRITIQAEASEAIKAFVSTLVERAENIAAGKVKPSEDNMLSVTFDGRCAATDMRLVGGCDDPGSKVNLCVEQLLRIHRETKASLGVQVVFLDLSTPKGSGTWSLYDDIRDKLVAAGIPEKEVAFIHEASTDAAKEKLFAAARSGKVRIVLGSTSKMGVGTNIQARLVALHHLDAPWRPADVEQREGRIERQGNLNAEVFIYRYVTKGSFDAYMWQTLETKARFIAQVMEGGAGRSAEDAELSALTYAEVKALASGNPLVLEKAGVDADVAKLTVLYRHWERSQSECRYNARVLPARLLALRKLAEAQEADVEALEDVRGHQFSIMLGERRITDRREAGRLLQQAVFRAGRDDADVRIGRYAGLELWMQVVRGMPSLYLKGLATWEAEVRTRHATPLDALHELVLGMHLEPQKTVARIARMERELAEANARITEGFDKMDRLRALLARQAEINRELGIFEEAKVVLDDAA